jgi:hypothetical protein
MPDAATGRAGPLSRVDPDPRSPRLEHPVATGRPATVRAWLERDLAPLHLLQAELVQDGIVKAAASANLLEEGA